MRSIFILMIVFFVNSLYGYELTIIQTISNSGRTFVTRNGHKDGISEGQTSSFTAKDVSIVAKAKTVTRLYTVWEVENENIPAPFKKGETVTRHNTEEYIWALMPYEMQEELKNKLANQFRRWSGLVRASFTQTLTSTISNVAQTEVQRGGMPMDALVEKEIFQNLILAGGFRYEREVASNNSYTYLTTRMLLLAEATYQTRPIEFLFDSQAYTGIGIGYGRSDTTSADINQSGVAILFPSIKAGLAFPLSKEYSVLFEGALDILYSKEELDNGTIQTTNQNNSRFGVGVRKFF